MPKKLPKLKGRAQNFTDKLQEVILNLYREGKTTDQVAQIIGVARSTLYLWQKDYGLSDAIKDAKKVANDFVEASLFQRACGYSHKAVKIFYNQKTGETVEHEYIQHYPPDPTAIIFWLKNRDPERWRDKQEIDHKVATVPLQIASDEQDL